MHALETDVAAALVVSIAMWKDATPDVVFPSFAELARIELGRIMSCQTALRRNHVRLSPELSMALHQPPWDALPPKELLKRYALEVPESVRDDLGRDLVEHGHESAFMLPPKRRTYSRDDFQRAARAATAVLGLPPRCSTQVCERAMTRYDDMYKHLMMPRTSTAPEPRR